MVRPKTEWPITESSWVYQVNARGPEDAVRRQWPEMVNDPVIAVGLAQIKAAQNMIEDRMKTFFEDEP